MLKKFFRLNGNPRNKKTTLLFIFLVGVNMFVAVCISISDDSLLNITNQSQGQPLESDDIYTRQQKEVADLLRELSINTELSFEEKNQRLKDLLIKQQEDVVKNKEDKNEDED